MTTATRAAIAEMHKRGHDGITIIDIARRSQNAERIFISGEHITLATALIRHVNETPNYRHCANCGGGHNIQQCKELSDAMAGASNFVSRFKSAQENAS